MRYIVIPINEINALLTKLFLLLYNWNLTEIITNSVFFRQILCEQSMKKVSIFDQTLNIGFDENQTDEVMLDLIEARVTELLTLNPELLFSYLYRLDIDEHKIKAALNAQKDLPNQSIAKLILQRQKLRIKYKKEFKQEAIDDENAF